MLEGYGWPHAGYDTNDVANLFIPAADCLQALPYRPRYQGPGLRVKSVVVRDVQRTIEIIDQLTDCYI